MAGKHGGVVGQAEQPLADALAQLFVVAASKVGAPDAAAEERVASEDPTLDFGIEADAASGMSGRADDLKGASPNLDGLAVLKITVGQLDVGLALWPEAEPHSLPFCLGNVVVHVRMCRNGDAVFVFDGVVADDVVDVAVRVDDHHGLEAVAVDEAEELVFFARR